ncbi:MAG: hypothetical protein KGS61_04705 [Verrucomicrobia bacterium]|nr:hypothetical protein [Verrucomicrobiota bacterium]
MKRSVQSQYTIRQGLTPVDEAWRRTTRRENKRLKAVAIEAITERVHSPAEPLRYHDLDFLIGSWVEDAEFDATVRQFDRINPRVRK